MAISIINFVFAYFKGSGRKLNQIIGTPDISI